MALTLPLALAMTLALTSTLTLGVVEELASFKLLTKLILSGAGDTTSITATVSFAVPTNVAPHVTALEAFPVRVFYPLPAWLRKPPALSRDGVTIEFTYCLWGFRRLSRRPSGALVTVKLIRRTRAIPAPAHRARDSLHLGSKVQIQIDRFGGHTPPHNEGHSAFDTPQAA